MMKFSVATFLTLATVVYAQRNPTPNNDFAVVTHPGLKEEVQTGTTYSIKWTVGADFEDVLVNIILVGGQSEFGQVPRTNITRGIPNSGEYKWEIPQGLGGLPWNGIAVESAENPNVDYQYSTAFLLIEDPDYVASSSLASAPSSATTSTSSSTAPRTVTSVIVITTTSVEPTSSADSSAAAPSSTGAETTSSGSQTPSDSAPAAASSSAPPEGGAAQAKAGALALAGGFALALFL